MVIFHHDVAFLIPGSTSWGVVQSELLSASVSTDDFVIVFSPNCVTPSAGYVVQRPWFSFKRLVLAQIQCFFTVRFLSRRPTVYPLGFELMTIKGIKYIFYIVKKRFGPK